MNFWIETLKMGPMANSTGSMMSGGFETRGIGNIGMPLGNLKTPIIQAPIGLSG